MIKLYAFVAVSGLLAITLNHSKYTSVNETSVSHSPTYLNNISLNNKNSANRTLKNLSLFFLCGAECGKAKYYVGYNRANKVKLGTKLSSLPAKPDAIFSDIDSIANYKNLPDIDERKIENRDSDFVISIHKIEESKIGSLKKSETLKVYTNQINSSAESQSKQFWGDTFVVTSNKLKRGTPVKVNIRREIGGYGNTVTTYAHYDVQNKTFLNGRVIKDLDFALKKDPGFGQKDKISGKDKITYTLITEVGDTFTIESLLEVTDGVKVNTKTKNEALDGADSVLHTITLPNESRTTACLKSASGVFNDGKCD